MLQRNNIILVFVVFGVGLILIGIIVFKGGVFSESKVEVIESDNKTSSVSAQKSGEIVVEIEGSVENPGVYKMDKESRIDDLLIKSGGLSSDADREYVSKNINRALRLSDGQKVYIPSQNEQTKLLSANVSNQNLSLNTTKVNINSASLEELDSLPGIGQVYGKKIIEQRPYSDVNELVSKKVLSQSLFDKIKDNITTY